MIDGLSVIRFRCNIWELQLTGLEALGTLRKDQVAAPEYHFIDIHLSILKE